jgi:DNA-directed RNA polymerase subunit RPC12/RpoP
MIRSPFRFDCPACGKRLKANPDKAGKKAACPKCGQHVVVPSVEGNLAPSSQCSLPPMSSEKPEEPATGVERACLDYEADRRTPPTNSHPVTPSVAMACLNCGQHIAVPQSLLGQAVKCPQCGGCFVPSTGAPSQLLSTGDDNDAEEFRCRFCGSEEEPDWSSGVSTLVGFASS